LKNTFALKARVSHRLFSGGKEKITAYTRAGKIDSTNVKIFSAVDESFEMK
jgi:hypothetical protein